MPATKSAQGCNSWFHAEKEERIELNKQQRSKKWRALLLNCGLCSSYCPLACTTVITQDICYGSLQLKWCTVYVKQNLWYGGSLHQLRCCIPLSTVLLWWRTVYIIQLCTVILCRFRRLVDADLIRRQSHRMVITKASSLLWSLESSLCCLPAACGASSLWCGGPRPRWRWHGGRTPLLQGPASPPGPALRRLLLL
jgi:hypothetical protein